MDESSTNRSFVRTAVDGALLNILNPKLSVFFLAFLPQFVPVSQHGSIAYLVYLAAIFMIMTFFVFIVYGLFASAARHYVLNSPSIMVWLQRSIAGAFGMLGIKLALTDR